MTGFSRAVALVGFVMLFPFAQRADGQCCPLMGDVNADGRVNGKDVQAFVDLISPLVPADRRISCADFNNDADVTPSDIAPFVTAMINFSPSITAFVLIDDPVTVQTDYLHVNNSIFRTLAPMMKVITNGIPTPLIQILIDDGDDLTDDNLDIRSLFTFDSSGIAIAMIPEFAVVGSLPGGDQSLRSLPDDPTQMRIVYYGENRIRVMQGPTTRYSGRFLAYEAYLDTVCGPYSGTESDPDAPGDPDRLILSGQIIMDFDEFAGVTDAQISAALCMQNLIPEGITRDLGVVQVTQDVGGIDLPTKIAQINGAGIPNLEDARYNAVALKPATAGENHPQAMVNDFRPDTNDWIAAARQQQYVHFALQTFPAHRLIDNEGPARILVFQSGSVGDRTDFSGMANAGNKYFVKGHRMKKPVRILWDGRVIKTDPKEGTDLPDGDLSRITGGDDHDTLVFSIIGGDGVGNRQPNDLHGDNIVLGTGKDADIRVVDWSIGGRGGELQYYKQLELCAADTSKIHQIEQSYSTKVAANRDREKNLIFKYKAITNAEKIIIGAAWNEDAEIYGCDTGRISPDRTIRRSEKRNGNVTAFNNKEFTSNVQALLNEYAGGSVELLKADDTLLGTFDIVTNTDGINSVFRLTANVPAMTAKFRNLHSDFKKRVLSVGSIDRVLVPNTLEVKRATSNKGTRLCVGAPGQLVRGTLLNGNLGNDSGTSFATPLVTGIAAEMMAVNPGLRTGDGLTMLLEIIEITADDLDAAGRDNNTGFGRVNFWKCILAALNNGASKEGRTDTTPADGKDDFFTSVTLKDAANTTWYGFEIRVKAKDAVVWFRTNDGDFVKVEDSGATRPPVGGGPVPLSGNVTGFMGMELTSNVTTEGADQFAGGTIQLLKADDTSLGTFTISTNTTGANAKFTLTQNVPANTAKFRNLYIKSGVIACYMSTQTLRNGGGKILPSMPFSAAELAGATMTQYWMARFNITKPDLEGRSHLLVMKPGKVPTGTNEGGDVVMSLPINIAQMRDPASAPAEIKDRVKEFDDFVFHCQKD